MLWGPQEHLATSAWEHGSFTEVVTVGLCLEGRVRVFQADKEEEGLSEQKEQYQ